MHRAHLAVLHVVSLSAGLLLPAPAAGQVDEARASLYFKEAARLCAQEGGRLWGVSLCGPIVIADPVTKTIATSQPAPDAPRPVALGFANAAMDWGGTRWTTIVWQRVPDSQPARGRLMIHELFHRVQPDLGLFVRDLPNDHLDLPVGRYWLQLEWRALASALSGSGVARETAIRDALAFRDRRRAAFRDAAESERLLEIQEGLAQYTGTVVATGSSEAAAADAIAQLEREPQAPTFVRTFAYPSGAAYGILLDAYAPGWTRRIRSTDDLGQLLRAATSLFAADDVEAAALRYGGDELRVAEDAREVGRQARLAELRRRFVDGPILVLPAGRGAAYVTTGIMPLPGAGTVYPSYRVTGEWGSLEASSVLVSTDRATLTLPAPASVDGRTLTGDGWTLTIAPGWVVRPGSRAGDYRLEPEKQGTRPLGSWTSGSFVDDYRVMSLDPENVARLNAIGVLTRREIELRVIAPIVDALGREFGRDRVLAIVGEVIANLAREQGRAMAAARGDASLATFAALLEPWTRDDAMRMEVVDESPTRFAFNVTRCRYAEMYRELGVPELGAMLSCARDAALIEGFNPGLTLTRTQTIMQGGTCCDFRYDVRSEGGGPKVPGAEGPKG